MFKVTATVDDRAIRVMLAAGEPIVELAAASALNKAAAKARTQATREISAEYKVKPQRIIRNRMRLDKADRRRRRNRAQLRFMTRGIPVAILSGVRDYGDKRGGVHTPQGNLPDAWMMKSKKGSQQKHVFRRTSKKRLPIQSQYIHPIKSLCQFIMWKHMTEEARSVMPEMKRQIILRWNETISSGRWGHNL